VVISGNGGTVDEAALALVRSNAASIVVTETQPSAELFSLLKDTGARFIVALEDPRAIVAATAAAGTSDLRSVVREVANVCPLLLDFVSLSGAVVIRAEDAHWKGIGLPLKVATEFGLVSDACGPDTHPWVGANDGLALPPNPILPMGWNAMIDGALGTYAGTFEGAPLGNITWTRELFSTGGDPSGYPQLPIDLRSTLNGRFLVYGPYLSLPLGTWSAEVFFGFSVDAVGQTIHLNIGNLKGTIATSEFVVTQPGPTSAEIFFSLAGGQNENVEIRILVGRDSAPGQMTFEHAVLRQIANGKLR